MPVDRHGIWWVSGDNPRFGSGDRGDDLTADNRAQYDREVNEWQLMRAVARAHPGLRRDREPPMAAHNRAYMTQYPKLEIDKMVDMDTYNRGVILPPFKVEYDSHEQIQQKLYGTVILIKGHPFYVQATIQNEDGTFGLLLANRAGNFSWCMYSEISDFRTLAPGYVNHSGLAYWVFRTPERQTYQGMTSRNTFAKAAGSDGRGTGLHHNTMLSCLTNRKNMPFQSNLIDLMEQGVITSIRLSNNLALHKVKNKGAVAGVEYIGRPFGLIVDGKVKVLDDADLGPTWIVKDCMDVNLELH